MKVCRIENCTYLHYCNDLCKKHYDKNRRHGDPLFERKLKQPIKCSVVICQNIAVRRNGMCAKHYINWQRHGDPTFINPKCNRSQKWTKERAYANTAKWKRENKKIYNAYLSSVKKHVKLATPKWLDSKLLQEVHKNCPDGYQVDHIIPIQNELVSGLNVPWNLQYLTAFENNSKNNKFDGTYQNESWREKIP